MARRKKRKLGSLASEWKAYSLWKSGFFDEPFIPDNRYSIYKVVLHIEKEERPKTSSRRAINKNDEYYYIDYRFIGKANDDQNHTLRRTCGDCRWLWNRYVEDGRNGKPVVTPAKIKKEEGHEWLADSDAQALCNVQIHYERAKSDYIRGEKGKPKFKKKFVHTDSYTTDKIAGSDNVKLDGDMLKLPKIKDPIKLIKHREIIEGGELKSVTVTLEPTGEWYFSLKYEYKKNPDEEDMFSQGLEEYMETGDTSTLTHVGLDMSLPHLFVASDGLKPEYVNEGNVVSFEKHYRKMEKKLAKEQRKLSHMVKDSANYKKQCIRIAKLHARTKHVRNDFLRQIAVRMARKYDVVFIEDLDMSAMKKSLKLGKSVSDNGWGFFTSELERKLKEHNHMLIRINKWFPSSKTCLKCGHVHKELKLSDRVYVCPKCGHIMDRDEQASVNIDNEGMRMLIAAHNGEYKVTPVIKVKMIA